MFLNFFDELRTAKVPVTLKEYLALLEGMDKHVIDMKVEEFYYLSRAILVKDERNLDKFDRVFSHAFKGLETLEGQIQMLAGLSEDTQVAFLRSTLSDFENATAALDGLVDAWATGDVDGIERLGVNEMREQSLELYDALLTRRNTNWAGQIQTLLEGSGTVFIAVGAAHLAGDDSVQEILADRGVAVEVAR
jgi:uncharacterized protein YbaP (TraB family)